MISPAGALARRSLPLSLLRSVRAYATTQSPTVTPPAAVFGLDGTYATALYTAAAKTSSMEPTARAIGALASLLKRDERLAGLVAAPALTTADRAAIVAELQKHGGGVAGGLLAALAEHNRLALLRGVCAKFAVLLAAARGEVEMVVTSATPLDARMLARLEVAAAKSPHVGMDKILKVTNPINPDIIGGLMVEIGDRTIDLSVSSRMAKMNKMLTDTL